MTTAINEVCIGELHKNCYLVRVIFLLWERSNFLAGGWDTHPIPEFATKVWGEGVGKFPPGVGNKTGLQDRDMFSKRRNAGVGTIVGDNPAGLCLVLRDLIPMHFLK